MIPAPNEPLRKMEMYSPQFYATCAVDGKISCGLTHLAYTPLNLVKSKMLGRFKFYGASDCEARRKWTPSSTRVSHRVLRVPAGSGSKSSLRNTTLTLLAQRVWLMDFRSLSNPKARSGYTWDWCRFGDIRYHVDLQIR
nr:mitochondrial phosphate carrier protein 3, mitochondrial-like [Tanacetum cinerariifolium]